jgi:hypothetical protein
MRWIKFKTGNQNPLLYTTMSLRSCVFTSRLRLCIVQTCINLYTSGSHRLPPRPVSRNRKHCLPVDYTVLLLWQNILLFPSMQGMYQGMITWTKRLCVHLQSENIKNWMQKGCGHMARAQISENMHTDYISSLFKWDLYSTKLY